jgi:hypothetical protein
MDYRIRPTKLSDSETHEMAAAFYSDQLPAIADALEMIECRVIEGI